MGEKAFSLNSRKSLGHPWRAQCAFCSFFVESIFGPEPRAFEVNLSNLSMIAIVSKYQDFPQPIPARNPSSVGVRLELWGFKVDISTSFLMIISSNPLLHEALLVLGFDWDFGTVEKPGTCLGSVGFESDFGRKAKGIFESMGFDFDSAAPMDFCLKISASLDTSLRKERW